MAAVSTVLVVGGSVAGMACALQLHSAGIAVELIELDPTWRTQGAGITITGPTLRALRTLGLLEPVLAAGATWDGARVHDQSGNLLEEVSFPALAADLPATGGVMRPELHAILSAETRRRGIPVRLGLTVQQLIDRDSVADVLFSDGSRASYDLVVGADGIFSAMRARVFPDAPQPVPTGQVIYRLVAERPPGMARSYFYMGRDCKLGFNPVSSTHMYMFLLLPGTGTARMKLEDQAQQLYEAMAGFGGFVPQIRETVRTVNAHTINYRPLEALLLPAPWHRGRVVLIGDAAHATTPHLASGAGMAIEDGLVLAEELRAQPSLPAALAQFMARRFHRCQLVVENSVRLGQIELNHGSPAEHTRVMSQALAALREPI